MNNLAQTSGNPIGINVDYAEGINIIDKLGKKYIDLISGIGVNYLGHKNPIIINAIKEQVDKYLHVMAYGEFIEEPQLDYSELLSSELPENLNSVYFVNSGTEAIEGALKLAKRWTGRTELISLKNTYYGGTHGSLSITGSFDFNRAFRPLLPDVRHIRFNEKEDLKYISKRTSCVVAECIQGEAGVILPEEDYLKELYRSCKAHGALLILDEVQTGIGRTGSLFGFEHFGIIPDILVLAKSLGGGMPLGAFISSKEIMSSLESDPVLGHITTFGGHPVCCAAGMAGFKILKNEKIYQQAERKGELFKKLLKHKYIKDVRGKGLMLAIEFINSSICDKTIGNCIKNGVITDSFIFAPECLRIYPPLIISENEIEYSCRIILESIN